MLPLFDLPDRVPGRVDLRGNLLLYHRRDAPQSGHAFAVSDGVAYGWAVCFLALAAALEELTIHLFQKEYSADRKTLFHRAEA